MSQRCPDCKFLNSACNIDELQQFQLIKNSLTYVPPESEDQDGFMLFDYPFIGGEFEYLFRPELSNLQGAKRTTRTLFNKLRKIDKIKEFDEEMKKSITCGHLKVLTYEEKENVLSHAHNFSFLNFVIKESSSSQRIRPVTNSSSHHTSGSINSHLPVGPNLISSIKTVYEKFRINTHVVVGDLSRCYRSIHTTERSGQMRLTLYPKSPHLPMTTDFEFDILFFLRATYGDSPIACCLETILRFFVAIHLESPLAVKLITLMRFVDDLLMGSHSKHLLRQAIEELTDALKKVGFTFKELVSNYTWFSNPNEELDLNQWIMVLSHKWYFNSDMLLNCPTFYPQKKVRGRYEGLPLSELKIDTLKITKRLMSRLSGQCYSLDGTMLGIIKSHFSILFGLICKISKTWDEEIQDKEILATTRKFLTHLKLELKNLKPMKRCHLPEGFSPRAINGFSDGAQYMSCFVFYLLSQSITIPVDTFNSALINAAAKRKDHSIPGNEGIAILMLVETVYTYLTNHYLDLFNMEPPDTFTVTIGTDSECNLWALSPTRIHKSVLIKNLSERIHLLTRDITRKHPSIKFIFYHCRGDQNPSDLNSKLLPLCNPVDLTNSNMWRHGPHESHTCDNTWPPADDRFFSVVKGTTHWVAKRKDSKNCRCFGTICGDQLTPHCSCSQCTSNYNAGPQGNAPMIFSLFSPFIKQAEERPSWLTILQKIPLISNEFFNRTLDKHSIKGAVASTCRFLLLYLDTQLLAMFNLIKTNNDQILPQNFLKLGFLTLVKKSTNLFPPTGNHIKYQKVADIYFMRSRYSNETQESVFGTNLIPLLSSKDLKMNFRLFQYAHIMKNPGHQFSLGIAHLPLNITLTRARFGLYATTTSHQRSLLSTQINRCTYCNRRKKLEDGRTFSHLPGDPMLAKFLNHENLLFNIISMDILSEISVLAHARARAKSTYKVSILMVMDYLSGALASVVIDDSKTTNIIKGLKRIFLRYKTPAIIISDHASQFVSISTNEDLLTQLTSMNIQILTLPAGHQFKNRIERTIRDLKKIFSSLKEVPDKSIYAQPQSLIELISKVEFIESTINNRPILTSSNGTDASIITPNLLLHPQASQADLQATVQAVLTDIFQHGDSLSLIGRDMKQTQNTLRLSLLDYLQNSAIRFILPSRGHNQKPVTKHLIPMINDVVMFRDSSKVPRLGIIISIEPNNMVCVKHKKYSDITETMMHIRLLALLHRPSEINQDGFPIKEDTQCEILPGINLSL